MATVKFTSVKELMEDLEEFTARVVVELASDVTNDLIRTTPKKSGWAKANWVPSIGTPVLDGKGIERAGSTLIGSAKNKQTKGLLGLFTSGYKPAKGPIFVANGVPYIELLNDGSSKQAPSGFVQGAIERSIKKNVKGHNK